MTVELRVPVGQTRSITMALHSLASEIRTLSGCVNCSVSSDIGARGTVRYVEEWQNEDDLRHRLQADTFAELVSLMENATQPPRIEFELARGRRGFDYLDEVRGGVSTSERGGLR
jgi:quinol monooxygenase YgiN